MNIIEQMLSKYEIESEDELINALKEIYQEIALLGLYRGDFFQKAAFYRGTALRIIHGLNRFSEDLDFSLLKKDPTFDIETYITLLRFSFFVKGHLDTKCFKLISLKYFLKFIHRKSSYIFLK
jgi:predicted nucleotidyltransferase component of viral defense system